MFDNLDQGVNGTVVKDGFGGVWFVGKEEVTRSSTTCLRFGEVGAIAVDVQDHIAGIVTDRSIWMCCTVV